MMYEVLNGTCVMSNYFAILLFVSTTDSHTRIHFTYYAFINNNHIINIAVLGHVW